MPLVRTLIPSMFHRRLLFLALTAFAAMAVLAGQAYRLTVVRHEELFQEAASRLVNERWTPTVRGRILDRKGRVLAKDEASFDVLVDYRVLTEEWAYSQAARRARREHGPEWSKLDAEGREALIADALPEYAEVLRSMWRDLAAALQLTPEELEDRRAAIRETVQAAAATVWQRRLEARREEINRARESATEIGLADVAKPLEAQQQPHVIARDVDERAAFDVRRLSEIYPGLRVERGGRRVYPFESMEITLDRSTFPAPARPLLDPKLTLRVDGVATHLLGWMRSLQREDLDARPPVSRASGEIDRGLYLPGDLVGSQGVEAAHESTLRGLRGRVIDHLDTGSQERIEPAPGDDVPLTIDVMLQARIQAVMTPDAGLARVQPWHASTSETQIQTLPIGTPLNGAAVVVEIDSGEVLACVTTPTFTRTRMREQPDRIWRDPIDAPWVNRAIGKPYPPGSIVKPLILCAAVTEGVHALDHAIDCTGHLYPDKPAQFRCWVYKQFGRTHNDYFGRALVADEAVSVSCNIFFYTLGRALGPERITKWYRAFGVGARPGWGLGPEFEGTLGAPGRALEIGDATLMGIGQGPVAWTPLHAASAYATLARGGVVVLPRITRDARPAARRLALDPRAVDAALEGLRRAVNDEQFGTGEHLTFPPGLGGAAGGREKIFTARGVSVWGKTGTAEAPDIVTDPDGPGGTDPVIMRRGDHSWFVILVGPERGPPKYAVAVMMEYAGSGARVSGPIANQIILALQAEGYL